MDFNMPEITKCFGTFPPKYATYLISIFGMGSGGVGLAGIILYGLIENSILGEYINSGNIDESVRKAFLLTIGLTSLLLTIGNVILFLGVTSTSRGTIGTGVMVIFVMCMCIIMAVIGAPLSCFFVSEACIISKMSLVTIVLGILVITVFLEIWLYFMIVAHNYANQI
ncbi:uncharacterized protein [Epargyreus clarus]|uniref:uncharacterized protein n=1 Tax=Epargyreus clarus TaxID=520877 RepID=UPI003C2B6776